MDTGFRKFWWMSWISWISIFRPTAVFRSCRQTVVAITSRIYTPANYPLSRHFSAQFISRFLPVSTPSPRTSALPLFTNTRRFYHYHYQRWLQYRKSKQNQDRNSQVITGYWSTTNKYHKLRKKHNTTWKQTSPKIKTSNHFTNGALWIYANAHAQRASVPISVPHTAANGLHIGFWQRPDA